MLRGGRVEVLTAWIAPLGNDSPTAHRATCDLGMATLPRNGQRHNLPRKRLQKDLPRINKNNSMWKNSSSYYPMPPLGKLNIDFLKFQA